MVEREEIRWAYKILLGREPESEDAYNHHSTHADLDDLRFAILCSEEGLYCLKRRINMSSCDLPFNYYKVATAFIHIPKTGGTAVHNWLAKSARLRVISNAHQAFIQSFTIGELNQLDLISGHFTFQEAMALPYERKRLICCFRDPVARLISLYRFHRSHPLDPASSRLICLAQNLEAHEFFAHDEVRAMPEVSNRYLSVLSDGGSSTESAIPSCQERLPIALERLQQIEGILITERMNESAEKLSKRFDYKEVSPPLLHVTDKMHLKSGFRQVNPVEMTRELLDLLHDLTMYDYQIYNHAVNMIRDHP